jgi:glycerol kinase
MSADAPLILGIDDGTTAVKVTLFDARLQPIAAARRPVATSHPAPGRVEQDAGEVLEAVLDAVAELLPAAEGRPITATGLDHQGESVLAWHPVTREPVSPIIVWQDKRGAEAYDDVAPELLARTGLPPDPYFSAPKLAWLVREHGPDVRLGTVDAWLSDRLGAGWATDPSTASRTALQALGDVGWDTALCAAFGIPRTSLPEVRPTVGDLGTLRHERWPIDLPLRARVCDQQAALAGAGCTVPGRAKATYGTGVFVLAHAGATPPHAEGLLPTVAWQVPGRIEYALDGGVFTAGALLEWLAGTLGLAADPEALTELAATVPDAGGVRVLPALAGAGAPWWRPDARAVIAGLTAGSTPAHIARAAVEAIVHRVGDVVDAMGGVDVLRIDGGLTSSPLLCRLQADVLGVAVERSGADATVAGAAGLALVGAGLRADVRDLDGLLAPAERIEPTIGDDERRAARATWSAFVQRALDLH